MGENAEEEEADEDPAPPPRDAPPADRPPTEEERRQAEAVVRHYHDAVGPEHRETARAVEAVVARLRGGDTVEQLRRAADAYAAERDGKRKDATFRQMARTFYGDADGAKYIQYRDRPPRVTPADRPDLLPAAQELLALYRRVVQSSHPEGDALDEVVARLAEGVPAGVLKRACLGYAAECDRTGGRKPLAWDARMGAPRFFRADWKRFRDYRLPGEPPPLPPEVQALHDGWRRRAAARPEAGDAARNLLDACHPDGMFPGPGRTPERALVGLILHGLLAEGADGEAMRRAIGSYRTHCYDAGTPLDLARWRDFFAGGAWREWDRELVGASNVRMAVVRHSRRQKSPLTADQFARDRRTLEVASAPDHPAATPQARQAAAEPEARALAEKLLGRPDGGPGVESPPPAA